MPLNGAVRPLATKGLIENASPSPDGPLCAGKRAAQALQLYVTRELFPLRTGIVTLKTGATKSLFDRPLVDNLPIAFDGVPLGPREYEWRSDAPATLAWIEAADGGDPKKDVPVHDRLLSLSAPFESQPVTLLESPPAAAAAVAPCNRAGRSAATEMLSLSVSRWSCCGTEFDKLLASFGSSALWQFRLRVTGSSVAHGVVVSR